VFHTVEDLNEPPLLPGDEVIWWAALDLRNAGDTRLDHYHENIPVPGPSTVAAIPDGMEFVDWVSKPLEVQGAVYEYDLAARTIRVFDPDPANPPDVVLTGGTVAEIVSWRARIDCDVALNQQMCQYALYRRGGSSFAQNDDINNYASEADSTCISAIEPDFSRSRKAVQDFDLSGDAQPGELLWFQVIVENSGACDDLPPSWPPFLKTSPPKTDCSCDADDVQLRDFVDTTHLEEIVPLGGGILTAPDEIEWQLPAVGSNGRPRSALSVYFQARVRLDVNDGDRICNTAEVTARELTNVADGGISNCPTQAPTRLSLDPCIPVRIPLEPYLVVETRSRSPTPAVPMRPTSSSGIVSTRAGIQPR